MKNYTQLIAGIVIGSALTGSFAFANNLRTFLAEEADFPVMVNGSPVTLDMPVVTIQDRTYLPLRAMGNVLGIKVDWNEEKAQAEVVTDATPAPTSTATPTPEATPTPTDATATPIPTDSVTGGPLYTNDGLEIEIGWNHITGEGYVLKGRIEKKLKAMGYTYRFGIDMLADESWNAVITDIPHDDFNQELIPLDFYYSTISPYILSLPKK